MAEVSKDKLAIQKGTQPQTPTKKKPRDVGSTAQTEKKKTFGERIADNFMNIDFDKIKTRLVYDWLFPEIISTMTDILRMIFSKDGKGGRSSDRRRKDGYRAYGDAFDEKRRDRDRDRDDIRTVTKPNFRKIRFEFYEEEDAREVIDDLRESLASSQVSHIPVRELYSHPNINYPTNPQMLKWGWSDLEDCYIERVDDTYVLVMPPAEVIK